MGQGHDEGSGGSFTLGPAFIRDLPSLIDNVPPSVRGPPDGDHSIRNQRIRRNRSLLDLGCLRRSDSLSCAIESANEQIVQGVSSCGDEAKRQLIHHLIRLVHHVRRLGGRGITNLSQSTVHGNATAGHDP